MRDIVAGLFSEIINISFQAGIVILAVLLIRTVLNRLHGPRSLCLWLWVIPFCRLLLPLQPRSIFSLLPRETEVAPQVLEMVEKTAQYVTSGFDERVLRIPDNVASVHTRATIMSNVETVLYTVWLVGIGGLMMYSIFSILRLKKKLRVNLRERENVYLVDGISGAFVLGVIRPHIYLPSDIPVRDMEYVIAHEQQHVCRGDHVFKLLAYFICCVYWIQPLVWVAYCFLCRDMELACDESVIRSRDEAYRKEYAGALLELSVAAGKPGLVPLAFTEKSPRERVKNIMEYKKPQLAVGIVGGVLLILLVLGFLTDPEPVQFGSARDTLWNPQIPKLEWGMSQEEAEQYYPMELVETQNTSGNRQYYLQEPMTLYDLECQVLLFFNEDTGLYRVMANPQCSEEEAEVLQEKMADKYQGKSDREINSSLYYSYESASDFYSYEEMQEAYEAVLGQDDASSVRLRMERPYAYHVYYSGQLYHGWLCMDASTYVGIKKTMEVYEELKSTD